MKLLSLKEATADSGANVVIHGPAGVGKTTLIKTLNPTSKVLIINADKGLRSIGACDMHIDVAQVSSVADMRQVVTMIARQSTDVAYDVIVLDSLTEIAEAWLADIKTRTKDGRAAYGELQDGVPAMLRILRDAPQDLYVICEQDRLEDDDGKIVRGPAMPGRLLPRKITHMFDLVLAMHVDVTDNGEHRRWLQTATDGRYAAKDRSGRLPAAVSANLGAVFSAIKTEDNNG